MLLLSAKPVQASLEESQKKQAAEFLAKYKRKPKLAVVLVGEDPASVIYTRKKGETAVKLGLEHVSVHMPATSTPEEVRAAVKKLDNDKTVDGILIQRPLPKSFKEDEVIYWVSPEKDVDSFHPTNTGLLALGMKGLQSCTPKGVIEMLKFYKIEMKGKRACVVGRSSIVGKPMAAMLLQQNCTVTIAHSQTADLKRHTRDVEILVVAAGKPEIITADYVSKGATVVDVGIHRGADGKLCGDVLFDDVSKVASAITPVPGGVGPLTISMLMQNTIDAAFARAK